MIFLLIVGLFKWFASQYLVCMPSFKTVWCNIKVQLIFFLYFDIGTVKSCRQLKKNTLKTPDVLKYVAKKNAGLKQFGDRRFEVQPSQGGLNSWNGKNFPIFLVSHFYWFLLFWMRH